MAINRYSIVDTPRMDKSVKIIGDIKHGEWVKFKDVEELFKATPLWC